MGIPSPLFAFFLLFDSLISGLCRRRVKRSLWISVTFAGFIGPESLGVLWLADNGLAIKKMNALPPFCYNFLVFLHWLGSSVEDDVPWLFL